MTWHNLEKKSPIVRTVIEAPFIGNVGPKWDVTHLTPRAQKLLSYLTSHQEIDKSREGRRGQTRKRTLTMPGLCCNSSMLLSIRHALEILPMEKTISTTGDYSRLWKNTRKLPSYHFSLGKRSSVIFLQYLLLHKLREHWIVYPLLIS